MVETPVLFETFVRVDYARQVWDAIKASQPKTLYFYSNKGRAEKEGEIEWNNEIRSWVNEIDWDCDLHTWFREECVDVYTSLRGAISWLFDNEEEGIILEDDCVPTKAFFSFCDQMIVKFRDEKKIWCISGDNFVDESLIPNAYYFSHYHYMYGWATWANRWKRLEWQTTLRREGITKAQFNGLYKTRYQVRYRVREMRKLVKFINQTKCWDYLLGYTMDCSGAFTVHPKYHLVTNVGLCGTHHENGRLSVINKPANPSFDKYIIGNHPVEFSPNYDVDFMVYKMLQYVSIHQKVRLSLQYRVPFYWRKIKNMLQTNRNKRK